MKTKIFAMLIIFLNFYCPLYGPYNSKKQCESSRNEILAIAILLDDIEFKNLLTVLAQESYNSCMSLIDDPLIGKIKKLLYGKGNY